MMTAVVFSETSINCEACGAHDWQLVRKTGGGPYLRCRCCRYHIQDPETLGARQDRFEDAQSKIYDDDSLCVTPLFSYLQKKRIAKRLRIVQRVLPGGRLLEVGPGNGEMLRTAKDCGYEVEAIEHSSAMAEVIEANTGAKVRVGAFETQMIEAESFDAYMSFHVIEHVPEVGRHLEKAYEVVRPSGFAFIATPNAGSWEHRTPSGLSPNYSTAHLQVFSEQSMRCFLERAGWELLEVHTPSYTDGWARVATSMLRRLRGKGDPAERGKLLRKKQFQKAKRVLQVVEAVTFPLRRIQEALHRGNELFIVARRRP